MFRVSFNVNHSLTLREKKTTKAKELYAQRLTPFCTYFPLELYLLHLMSLPLPSC